MQFQGKAGTQMIQQQEKGPERNTYTLSIPAGQGKKSAEAACISLWLRTS